MCTQSCYKPWKDTAMGQSLAVDDGGSNDAADVQVIVGQGNYCITKDDVIRPSYHSVIENHLDRLHQVERMAAEAGQYSVAFQCIAFSAKFFGLTSTRAESWMLKQMTNAPNSETASPRLTKREAKRRDLLAKEHAAKILQWTLSQAEKAFEFYGDSLRAYNEKHACFPIDGIITSWYWMDDQRHEDVSDHIDAATKTMMLDALNDEVFILQFTRFINEHECASNELTAQLEAFITASSGAWSDDDKLSDAEISLFTNMLKDRKAPLETKSRKPPKKKS